MNTRRLVLVAIIGAGMGVVGGLIHPFGDLNGDDHGVILYGANAEPSILKIIERSCQNCHSQRTEWPLYARIAPSSWLLEWDVSNARARFNMSRWGEYKSARQESILSTVGVKVRTGQMPPSRYLLLHREAALTLVERQQIYEWSREERKRVRADTDSETNAH